MRIQKVEIKGFRSIHDETIDVGNLNIFVGLNDSGKSNLLKALNLFFNGETGWQENLSFQHDFNIESNKEYEKTKDERKTPAEIEIKLTFKESNGEKPVWVKKWQKDGTVDGEEYDANYTKASIKNSISKNKRKLETATDDADIHKLEKDIEKLDVELKAHQKGFRPRSRLGKKMQNIQYIYVPATKSNLYAKFLVKRISKVLSDRSPEKTSATTRDFEQSMQTMASSLFTGISQELNIQSRLTLPDLGAILSDLELIDDRDIGLARRGDGIRNRHIPIFLQAISELHKELKAKGFTNDHFIWGYEEPENHVEIKQCIEMASQLHDKSKNHQIFLTTHSPAFYNIPFEVSEDWEQGASSIYRYYADIESGNTKYIEPDEEKLKNEFLLPSVSRMLAKQQTEIKSRDDRIRELESHNMFNKGGLFVEGNSDKTIFETALKLLFPNFYNNIKVKSGHNAQGVANDLIAWHYYSEQAKRRREGVKKAIGYFDRDKAGITAAKQFKKAIQIRYFDVDFKHSEYAAYKIYYAANNGKNHIATLQKKGIKILCSLENLYSPDFWALALQKNWLKERENAEKVSLLSRAGKNEIAGGMHVDKYLDQTFLGDENLIPFLKYEFKDFSKRKAADYIHALSLSRNTRAEAEEYLHLILKMLRSHERILRKLAGV